MGGEQVRFDEVLHQTDFVIAMTEFSATAPLMEYSQQLPTFRAASMPMVHQGMMIQLFPQFAGSRSIVRAST
jgi:hypothetical protein